MNRFLISRKSYFKMTSNSSEYEDNEFEDEFDDDSVETEESEN